MTSQTAFNNQQITTRTDFGGDIDIDVYAEIEIVKFIIYN